MSTSVRHLVGGYTGWLVGMLVAGWAGLAAGAWSPLPGAPQMAPELMARLTAAYERRGPGWKPRTVHFGPDGRPRYVNRLILEDSPYLLQHAHNPVDWHPWGQAALATARRLDRPVFLSIGYSTCHWCHVMERESFDDEAIAAEINAHFVAVKVDRERRPDVDEVYMTAALLSAGHGGWPLSVFALPDGRPFFVTTYLPPEQFRALLERVNVLWRTRRDELEAAAAELSQAVSRAMAARHGTAHLDIPALYARALRAILADHDELNGGFGTAPKFPEENRLLLLLDQVWRSAEPHPLAVLVAPLDAMARGGIYDQVGGGFHRYATDPQWLVPHFEKMLYNQARLARLYTSAWALTGIAEFRRVAMQTLDYVLRDLTSPQGGFYSARDADSEGREGAFYLWTLEALEAALGKSDAELAAALFGVSASGHFEGESIPHLPQPLGEFARERGLSPQRLEQTYERIRDRLRVERAKRTPPHRDEKVITAWNGMMIAALADAARALTEPCTVDATEPADAGAGDCPYLDAARRAARFLLRVHREGGRLWRLSLAGRPAVEGRLSDYAWLVEALVALYDADGDPRWLDEASALARAMIARFQDVRTGAFYLTAHDVETMLFTRPRSPVDGALPSGDAIAVRALARLARRTGEDAFSDAARRALASLGDALQEGPDRFPYLLLAARILQEGESGPLRYAARGRVRLAARLVPSHPPSGRVSVALRIRPGWHVNAADPGVEDLVPTRLTLEAGQPLAAAGPIVYPPDLRKRLRFADRALRLYEGEAVLTVPVRARRPTPDRAPLGRVAAQIQACSDQVCLAPENPRLSVGLWPLLGPLRSDPHGD